MHKAPSLIPCTYINLALASRSYEEPHFIGLITWQLGITVKEKYTYQAVLPITYFAYPLNPCHDSHWPVVTWENWSVASANPNISSKNRLYSHLNISTAQSSEDPLLCLLSVEKHSSLNVATVDYRDEEAL